MYTENFSRWLDKATWKIKYAYVYCISTFVSYLWFKIENEIVSWNYNKIDLLSKERRVNVIGVLRIVVKLCLLFRRDPFEQFILEYSNFDRKRQRWRRKFKRSVRVSVPELKFIPKGAY